MKFYIKKIFNIFHHKDLKFYHSPCHKSFLFIYRSFKATKFFLCLKFIFFITHYKGELLAVTLDSNQESGKVSPCRPSSATLRCDPARRPRRTALSRISGFPFIPVRAWWGKKKNSGRQCCARWSVCWWGRTWLSVQPCIVRHNISYLF